MKSNIHQLLTCTAVATLWCLAASPSQAYTMGWESNDFDTGPGNWLLVQPNAKDTVDWKNSNLAGGTAGELGGTFTRNEEMAYFARDLGVDVSLNDELWATGIFSVAKEPGTATNNSVYLGYFNTSGSDSNGQPINYIGWRTREPIGNGTVFRSRARIAVADNITTDQSIEQRTSYGFEIHWIPSGLGDGTGRYIGYVGDIQEGSFDVKYETPMGPMSMNAFGLWWEESATNSDVKFDAYFDNLRYLVVPEPSTPLLVAVGGIALWLTRRVHSNSRCSRNFSIISILYTILRQVWQGIWASNSIDLGGHDGKSKLYSTSSSAAAIK